MRAGEVKFTAENISEKKLSNSVSLETLNFLITLPGKVNKDIIKTFEKRGFTVLSNIEFTF